MAVDEIDTDEIQMKAARIRGRWYDRARPIRGAIDQNGSFIPHVFRLGSSGPSARPLENPPGGADEPE
jgi:hypothetical protein